MSLWENVHKYHQSLSGDLWFACKINSLVSTDYLTAAQHHLSPPRNLEDFLDNVAGSSFKRHCQWSSNLFELKQNWNERAIQWVSEVKELVTNKYPIHENKLLLTGHTHTLSFSLFFFLETSLPLRPQRSQPDPCCSQSAGQQRHVVGAGL